MQISQLEGVSAHAVPSWADCLQAADMAKLDGLVAPTAAARVLALAATLPALPGGGLECHLKDRERVDVAVRLLADDGGRDALLARHPALRFPAALTTGATWQRLRTLGERWATAGTAESRELSSVWLEFDLPEDEDADPARLIPSVFLGCRTPAHQAPSDKAWLADAATLLAAPRSEPVLRAALVRAEAQGAAGAELAFVGLMLSREEAGVRVVLKGLDAAALHRRVAALGWTGDLDALAQALGELVPREAALALHLDLAPELGPRIGVEIALKGHPLHTPGWQQLLRGLVARQACTDAAAQTLVGWPGLISVSEGVRQRWPGLAPRGIARRINHVKLSFHAERPLVAKAYLYCGLLG